MPARNHCPAYLIACVSPQFLRRWILLCLIRRLSEEQIRHALSIAKPGECADYRRPVPARARY